MEYEMNSNINKIYKLVLIGFLIITTFGCEDVIEVDLNSTNPQIVIEGSISDDNSKALVTITKSTDFYQPGIYQKISGATIALSDNNGVSYNFVEISDGIYESVDILGESNVEYSLNVIAEGESYEAVSTMPNQLVIDSLTLEEGPTRPGNNEPGFRFFIHIYFQDQPNIEDYCRFKLYNNGVQLGGFYIYEDRLTDGNYIDYRLLLDSEENDLRVGDNITVELMSIDVTAYEYYKTANSVNASGSTHGGPSSTSAAPTNPLTNWSNKALGFFTAYTSSKDSIIIRELF
jgi:hypothetical protein